MNLFNFLKNGLITETTLHPLIIHVPIVLFPTFICLYFIYFINEKLISRWILGGMITLTIAFSLFAKVTGENAGIIVGPDIPNPRLITEHAKNALIFIRHVFLVGFIFFFSEWLKVKNKNMKKITMKVLGIVVMLIGMSTNYWLIRTGHTGATLVFKYAAGVKVPLKRAQKVINASE